MQELCRNWCRHFSKISASEHVAMWLHNLFTFFFCTRTGCRSQTRWSLKSFPTWMILWFFNLSWAVASFVPVVTSFYQHRKSEFHPEWKYNHIPYLLPERVELCPFSSQLLESKCLRWKQHSGFPALPGKTRSCHLCNTNWPPLHRPCRLRAPLASSSWITQHQVSKCVVRRIKKVKKAIVGFWLGW